MPRPTGESTLNFRPMTHFDYVHVPVFRLYFYGGNKKCGQWRAELPSHLWEEEDGPSVGEACCEQVLVGRPEKVSPRE